MFCKKQLDYLGFVVNADGIMPNPKKVKTVAEWAYAKNAREIRAL